MAQTGSKMEYFVQDENGKIVKVIQHSEIKREPKDSSSVYAIDTNGESYPDSSSSQFVRFPKDYNIQSTPATKNSGHHSSASLKYQNNNLSLNKIGGKVHNFIFSNNISQPTSSKSKPTTSAHQTVQSGITRRRKPEKAGKGLRHFSMKVCEKVKEKGTTTYNEVADELVAEEVKTNDSANCDQKNIRRRVYDALNVLMAMNIILKDKKEIRWIGLPTNSVEQCTALEKENEKRRQSIEAKSQQLKELFFQQIAFKGLIDRNKEAESHGIIPTPNSSVQLPFIIVNTHKSTRVNCSVTNDKSEYFFKFDDKFEIHDDIEVMKRMGLLLGLDTGECSYEDLQKAKSLVPKNFAKYIDVYGRFEDSDVKMKHLDSSYNDSCQSLILPDTMSNVLDQSDFNEDDLISESSDT